MLVYRGEMLLLAVFVPIILIILVLGIPVLIHLCWNKCGCCRRGCHKCYRTKHKRMRDEWVSSGSTANPLSDSTKRTGEEKEDDRYQRLFDPGLPAQIFVYLCIGFILVAICALTDVPFYVMWIVFFIVWTALFIDFLKRIYAEKVERGDIPLVARVGKRYYVFESVSLIREQRSPSKEKFDAYEAAGISRDNIIRRTRRYMNSCKYAISAYKFQLLVAVIAIIIITGISTIFSSCLCVATSPTEASSYLSRRIGHKYCKEGEICNVYFTLADTESDMIVNFHSSESPDVALTAYDIVSHARGNGSIEDYVASYAFHANATSYKMDTVRELKRWVNWADVTNLTADTTYYFIAVYIKNGKTIVSDKEYKVRTVPTNGTYNFVTGGDVSSDINSEKLIKHAASTTPYFAVIGGDNAYDNGFKTCYLRWDKWFHRWDAFMTQNDGGYSIPLILAIGNHETGGFGAQPGDDPYYTAYFPQQLNLQNVNPRFRQSYHSHRLGDSTFIILDSDVVARMNGPQRDWLEAELSASTSKVKIAVYHGNIYPSAHLDAEMARKGREYWVPLFDQYNVTIVFENHLHLFKRTKPLRNNKVDPNGITYFGDGTWGVMSNIVKLSHEYYIEKVNRNQHFFSVTMQNYSYITVSATEKSGNVFDYWEKRF